MPCKNINNQSNLNIEQYKPYFDNFFPYTQKVLEYDKPFSLNLVSDQDNASKTLGKTAYYDPNSYEVTIYTDGRHIKDILRSISHELVHHTQNCRGEFDREFDTGEGYAQKDGHLRSMEREAYEKGNMLFRDWEDGYKRVYGENVMKKSIKLLKENLDEVVTKYDKCPSGQKKIRKAGGVYECIPDPEAAATQGAHFSAATRAELKQKALKYCTPVGPAARAQNWAVSLNKLTSDKKTLYKCAKGRKIDQPTPAPDQPKSDKRCIRFAKKRNKKRKNWYMYKKCLGTPGELGPVPVAQARQQTRDLRDMDPTGSGADLGTGKTTTAPDRAKASLKKSTKRRAVAGVNVRSKKVQRMQQFLLSGAEALLEEKLNESYLSKKLLGTRLDKGDGKIGPTTLGTLRKIKTIPQEFLKNKYTAAKNIDKILDLVGQCHGQMEKCVADAPKPDAPKPSVKGAEPTPADTKNIELAKKYPEEARGREGGKGWGGAKCRYASAGSTRFNQICKKGHVCLQSDGDPVSFFNPTGKCENPKQLKESKYKTRYISPVKDRMAMLHEHLKRNVK